MPLHNSIIRQAIDPDSLSNPQNMQQVFQFAFKKF